eukprot:NODE_2660_length_1369_cov_89.569021_g2528_i0.p1 GENE.NODE_2660_length_1369_cov_89.569021_g2528_i0~~NODE_2660_length_1369_cov_89.569021_g2528_i0.p1  ORF type:complete len:435 (+),score=34.43 NODE_2660_length_1369_cov_89.569021_g2528_i0:50-1354(+)
MLSSRWLGIWSWLLGVLSSPVSDKMIERGWCLGNFSYQASRKTPRNQLCSWGFTRYEPRSHARYRRWTNNGCHSDIDTPLVIQSWLPEFGRGKVFCDVGCREGDLLSKVRPFAKRVVCIEQDPERAKVASSRGIPTVVGNLFNMTLPKCDIFWIWIGQLLNVRMADFLASAVKYPTMLLVGGDTSYAEAGEYTGSQQPLQKKYGGTVFKFPYDEGDQYRNFGVFTILALPLNRADVPHVCMSSMELKHRAPLFTNLSWTLPLLHASSVRPRVIPEEVAAAIIPFVTGKRVCDFGGPGYDLSFGKSLLPHASNVTLLADHEDEYGYNWNALARPINCDVLHWHVFQALERGRSLPLQRLVAKAQHHANVKRQEVDLILTSSLILSDGKFAELAHFPHKALPSPFPRPIRVIFDNGPRFDQFGVYLIHRHRFKPTH